MKLSPARSCLSHATASEPETELRIGRAKTHEPLSQECYCRVKAAVRLISKGLPTQNRFLVARSYMRRQVLSRTQARGICGSVGLAGSARCAVEHPCGFMIQRLAWIHDRPYSYLLPGRLVARSTPLLEAEVSSRFRRCCLRAWRQCRRMPPTPWPCGLALRRVGERTGSG